MSARSVMVGCCRGRADDVLEQVVVLSDADVMQPADLPASIQGNSAESSADRLEGRVLTLGEVQRRHKERSIDFSRNTVETRSSPTRSRRYRRQQAKPDNSGRPDLAALSEVTGAGRITP